MMGKGRKSRRNQAKRGRTVVVKPATRTGRYKVTVQGKDTTVEIDAREVGINVDRDYLDVTSFASGQNEYLVTSRTWTITAKE